MSMLGKVHCRENGEITLALAKCARGRWKRVHCFHFAQDEADVAHIAQAESDESSFCSHCDPDMVTWVSERQLAT